MMGWLQRKKPERRPTEAKDRGLRDPLDRKQYRLSCGSMLPRSLHSRPKGEWAMP